MKKKMSMKDKYFVWTFNGITREIVFSHIFDEDDSDYYMRQYRIFYEVPSREHGYQVIDQKRIDKEAFNRMLEIYDVKELHDFEYRSMTHLIDDYADKFEALHTEFEKTIEDI